MMVYIDAGEEGLVCPPTSQHRRTGMRCLAMCLILFTVLTFATVAVGQSTAAGPGTEAAVCTFEDGKQLSVRYVPAPASKKQTLPLGKVWLPGGSPLTWFGETAVTAGNSAIPLGAYNVYIIPGKSEWTLVVSKNVAHPASYDEKQDLVRAPMQIGELSDAAPQLSVYFGHLSASECDMRLDYGKTRAWIVFKEK
jgi:Protein of unknown function (DUF2911)